MKELVVFFTLLRNFSPHLTLAAEWLLKTSALFLIALGFAALLKNRSARSRCWIWRLMFAGVALLLVQEFSPTVVQRLRPKIPMAIPMESQNAFWKSAQDFQLLRSEKEMEDIRVQKAQKRLTQEARELPPWETNTPNDYPTLQEFRTVTLNRLETGIPWIWGLGAGAAVLWIGGRTWASLRSLRVGSIPAPTTLLGTVDPACEALKVGRLPTVRLSSKLDAPLLFGLFRPLIYLPTAASSWDRLKLSDVFLHELAHWKRKDFAWLQGSRLMTAIFWWNPCFRYALRAMIESAEEAADDMVLLCRRPADAYARTLVEIAAGIHEIRPQGGLPMVGYRSLEKRIKSLMQENRWRGKLGKLAGAAIALTMLAGVFIVSVYVGAPTPVQANKSEEVVYMTKEQKALAEWIVANQKKRLEGFRFTHIKAESSLVEESDEKRKAAPMPSKMEVWWDIWARSYRIDFRPRVLRVINGANDFSIRNQTEISNGHSSKDEQLYPDLLITKDAEILMSTLSSRIAGNPIKTTGYEYTHRTVQWEGKEAVESIERNFRNGKLHHETLLILSPEENHLIRYYKSTFPNAEEASSFEKIVTAVKKASNGDFYASDFTTISQREGKKTTIRYSIHSLDLLPNLPSGILTPPANPEEQYISSGKPAAPLNEMALRCVNPEDQKPVAGVKLSISINHKKALNRVTDEDGRFTLPLPETAVTSLSIRAAKANFAPRVISWTRRNDPLHLPASYEIKLYKGSPIAGRVIDEEGKGIPNTDVRIHFTGGPRSWSVFVDCFDLAGKLAATKTDDEGNWSLPNFPDDLDGLAYRISCPGYQATTDAGISDFRNETSLPYSALRDGTAIITLKRGNELRGTITDSDGKPIEKCRIVLGKDIHGGNPPTTFTNAAGEYVLKGLQSEPTWITVESHLHRPVAKEIKLPHSGPLDFKLEAGGLIRGRVVKPDGSPSAGLNVGVDGWNKLRTLNFETKTDADGNFIWRGAPEEPVEFVFGACQSREFLSELPLSPSQAVQTITMKPALKFSGTVVDHKTGKSIPSVKMTFGYHWKPTDISWQTQEPRTFTEGKFDWEMTRFGKSFVFRFEAPGYEPFETGVLEPKQQEETATIRLKNFAEGRF